jgi:hypothetical protein
MAVRCGHFIGHQQLAFSVKLSMTFLTSGRLFSFSESTYLANATTTRCGR